ncbi:LysR substrate-binding domain-containing protein [Pseudomonas silesiensis]|uniref:LysR substrate-binding domain-containing protein n=1 Tax=Pseudomonas silesiensis TaxID=1853130 RepID=UPI003BB64B8C
MDIVDDGYDIAFRVGDLADSALIARVLAPYRLVLCAAPAYLERHGDIGHPRDLASYPPHPAIKKSSPYSQIS